MTSLRQHQSIARYLAALPLGVLLCTFPQQSQATDLADSPTGLADYPLVNGAELKVLPNIMVDLDDSDSMGYWYLPNDMSASQRNAGSSTSVTLSTCATGRASRTPCYQMHLTNGIYYNPAVTYTPPVDAAGVTMGSLGGNKGWMAATDTTFDKVPQNAYGVLPTNTATTNLVTGYPGQKFCTNNTSTGICSKNGAAGDDTTGAYEGKYMYPNRYYSAYTDNGPPSYYTGDVTWCTGYTGTRETPVTGTGACGTKTDIRKYPIYSNLKLTRVYKCVNNVTSPCVEATYPRAPMRSDCTGAVGPNGCSYTQEMRNFANWHAWYQTRAGTMKTALTLAFKDVRGASNADDPDDINYLHARVGFLTIHNTNQTENKEFLAIRPFNGAQRTTFYDRIIKMTGQAWTPLPASLSWVGRYYAGVFATAKYDDPVEYSCQRNYVIVATDGAWNRYSPPYNIHNANIMGNVNFSGTNVSGNPDYGKPCETESKLVECPSKGACPPATRPECDIYRRSVAASPDSTSSGMSISLADVAYYFYHTDLRKGQKDFETRNVPPSGSDPTMDDVAPWQHMTTFTVGLGLDGTIEYQPDYKTATSGDFWKIRKGELTWPAPERLDYTLDEDSGPQKVDDLWHAAVNGRGTYFSAQSPQDLVNALQETLLSIRKAEGSAAAAAVSNLQPVEGDNYAYVGSYQTVDWDGNMEAYAINPETGEISDVPDWQAQGQLNGKIEGDCGNNSEGRTIYFAKSGSGSITLEQFRWENLNSTQKAWFDASKLSQFQPGATPDLTTELGRASGATLVNYLRGENMHENRSRDPNFQTACPSYGAFYRTRQNILGDIVHAGPAYVGKPIYSYTDDGYDTFKARNRDKMVYAGANDGMLHAFDAATGAERWAFIPPHIMPNLFKLADRNYSKNHRYYVDGPLVTGDIQNGGAWKTILVGGLGKGGRGIYALDVTNPGSPNLLWTFSATPHDTDTEHDPDLGYTYGMPQITKLKNGTWVVVIASGYDNVFEGGGDGKGYVFVLNASSGKVEKKIGTGVGSTGNPSGLAALNGFVKKLAADNTALRIYGGDLLGNLWGFDINEGTSYQIASLGTTQPITVMPLVSKVRGSNVALLFGTGRYLGQSDLSGTQTGTVYAIKDKTITADGENTSKSGLVSAGELASPSSSFDWTNQTGWRYGLGTGQLVHVPATKYGNTLIVAATKPTSEKSCNIGGEGYVYMFNVESSQPVASGGYLTHAFSTPLFGLTTFQTAGKHGYVMGVGGDKQRIIIDLNEPSTDGFGHGRSPGTRMIWHELNSN